MSHFIPSLLKKCSLPKVARRRERRRREEGSIQGVGGGLQFTKGQTVEESWTESPDCSLKGQKEKRKGEREEGCAEKTSHVRKN